MPLDSTARQIVDRMAEMFPAIDFRFDRSSHMNPRDDKVLQRCLNTRSSHDLTLLG